MNPALAAPGIEPALVREHALRLVHDEISALDALEQLLLEERTTLEHDDVDRLADVSRRRHECVKRLLGIDDERRNLCRMLSLGDDASAFPRLIDWCDEDGRLRAEWRRCLESAARCRDQNDGNGRIVTARLQRVRGLLDVLAISADEPSLYGATGTRRPAPATSHLDVSV